MLKAKIIKSKKATNGCFLGVVLFAVIGVSMFYSAKDQDLFASGIIMSSFSCIFLFVAILLLVDSNKRELKIEDGKIKGWAGFGLKCDRDLSQLVYVDYRKSKVINPNSFIFKEFVSLSTIYLYFNDKTVFSVTNVENAEQIVQYLYTKIKNISFSSKERQDLLVKTIEKKQKNKKRYVVLITHVILLFVSLALCILLTEGKAIDQFNQTDWYVFIVFWVVFAYCLFASIFITFLCVGNFLQMKGPVYEIRRNAVLELPLPDGQVEKVVANVDYSKRCVLYKKGDPFDENIYVVLDKIKIQKSRIVVKNIVKDKTYAELSVQQKVSLVQDITTIIV